MKSKEEWASELVTPGGGDPIDNQEIVEGIVAEIQLDAFKAGMTKAADQIKNRREGYESEHGNVDPETGTMEFPKGGDEYVQELWEIEESITIARDSLKELP